MSKGDCLTTGMNKNEKELCVDKQRQSQLFIDFEKVVKFKTALVDPAAILFVSEACLPKPRT